MPNITHTDFVTLPTQDFERAVKFYGETLGLEEEKRYGQMPGVEFGTGNLTLAVLESEKFGMDFNVNKNPIALRVDDVEEARKELESQGIEFAADTMDSGVCHMAFFSDPDGNALMLHQPLRARGPGSARRSGRGGLAPMSKWTADSIPDQSGRTFVVTGANSGLGLETTKALAREERAGRHDRPQRRQG